MRLVIDVETDALEIDKIKHVWCIVAKDIDTGVIYVYEENQLEEFRTLAADADSFIGHNFIHYDYLVVERFSPGSIDPTKVIDTLVLSHLLNYRISDGEGHSLQAWGTRFDLPKYPSPDFNVYTPQMLEYCIRDVEINELLYGYLQEFLDSQSTIRQ
jgi:hypothetical protein